MGSLSSIRTQIRTLISEQDPNNTHFTDAELTEYVNQAQVFLATLVEYPRTITSAQVTQGTSEYTLPSDFISIISAYFGDVTKQNDIYRLRVLNLETLDTLYPSWLSTNTGNQGRPRFLYLKDRSTLKLVPTPDAENSATNKKYHLNYIKRPADLSGNTDTPDLPLPYHDLLQFYACHLGYLKLQVQEMADKMEALFDKKINALRSEVNKESKEQMAWQWNYVEDVSGESDIGITF